VKYAIEMGSGVMTYIPNFVKIGSGIQKLLGGINRQHGDRISLLQEIRLTVGLKMWYTDMAPCYRHIHNLYFTAKDNPHQNFPNSR
jgi:hypothetical protein